MAIPNKKKTIHDAIFVKSFNMVIVKGEPPANDSKVEAPHVNRWTKSHRISKMDIVSDARDKKKVYSAENIGIDRDICMCNIEGVPCADHSTSIEKVSSPQDLFSLESMNRQAPNMLCRLKSQISRFQYNISIKMTLLNKAHIVDRIESNQAQQRGRTQIEWGQASRYLYVSIVFFFLSSPRFYSFSILEYDLSLT